MGRKRKMSDSDLSSCEAHDLDGPQEESPAMRNSANARERQRMRVLSKAFVRLKTTLPWVPPDTKLSKLDTLRLASCYIAHLKQLLDEDNPSENAATGAVGGDGGGGGGQGDNRTPIATGGVHPMTLTWPFSFNGRPVPHPAHSRLPSSQGGMAKHTSAASQSR